MNDAPLQEFTRDEIEQVFSKFVKREIPPDSMHQYREARMKTTEVRDLPLLHVEGFLMPGNPVTRGDEIQGAHPVHGSDTGMNLSINTKMGLRHCFRCNSGGDALLAFAVREGIIRCDEARPGALSKKMREVRKALRARGYLKEQSGMEKPPDETPAHDRTEAGTEIHNKAMEILEHGDPVQYLVETAGTLHQGDKPLLTLLFVTIGCQCCTNTKGLHPGLSGESGKGKSDACDAVLHLVPEEWKVEGTLSPKHLYYHTPKPGSVVHLDEASNLHPDIQDIVKRSSSNYQKETILHTVDRQRPLDLRLAPRIAFFMTSVDAHFENQVLNRQLNLIVDVSPELDNAVAEFNLIKGVTGEADYPVNEDVEICREIIRILKKSPLVTVNIPFAKRIKWYNPENRRNLSMFLDTIRAYTAFYQKQRGKADTGHVIASEGDYRAAEDLWRYIAREQVSKMTRNETLVD